MYDYNYWIENLKLQKHPEGGYFLENYRSSIEIKRDALPQHFTNNKTLATSIYYLLETGDVSKFHSIQSDEIWYFHAGSPLTIAMIFPDGKFIEKTLGPEINKNQSLQILVPAQTIFGAYLKAKKTYSLVGCMVTPGFDFADFKMYHKNELNKMFPDKIKKEIIDLLGQ